MCSECTSSHDSMTWLVSELQCRGHGSKIALSLETYHAGLGNMSEVNEFLKLSENLKLSKMGTSKFKSGTCGPLY